MALQIITYQIKALPIIQIFPVMVCSSMTTKFRPCVNRLDASETIHMAPVHSMHYKRLNENNGLLI